MVLLGAQVFEYQMCSEESVDSHRFRDLIDEAAAEGKVQKSSAYKRWASKISKKKPPVDPLSWPPREEAAQQAVLAVAIRYVSLTPCLYTFHLVTVIDRSYIVPPTVCRNYSGFAVNGANGVKHCLTVQSRFVEREFQVSQIESLRCRS